MPQSKSISAPELIVDVTRGSTNCITFHFRLETVTMVRYDLSMVVTDQKHDEQFFHEGSHV